MIYNMALGCLAIFCVLGAFDGLYFHLIKYKLHLHEDSKLEHAIHSVRALLFVPIGYFIFFENSTGPSLYLALLLVMSDLTLEIIDIFIEKDARKNLGGVSSAEMVIHVFASSFRMAAIALVLAAKPAAAFSFESGANLGLNLTEPLPPPLRAVGLSLSVVSFVGGAASLLGMLWPLQKISVRSDAIWNRSFA